VPSAQHAIAGAPASTKPAQSMRSVSSLFSFMIQIVEPSESLEFGSLS
jgi:hypothetical protein